MMKTFRNTILAACTFGLLAACDKQDQWLDERYYLSDVVPETLEDFQGLLDNADVMNGDVCNFGLVGTDNFYVLDNDLATLPPYERNAYMWSKDIYQSTIGYHWIAAYNTVKVANVVLEGLEKIKEGSATAAYREIKGAALFFRATTFYHLANTFAKPYSATASHDLGIVLRTTSDVNAHYGRATLEQTYQKILQDLTEAAALLPARGAKVTRPSQAAAYAMLAKTYLQMQDYANAEMYASKALVIQSTLLDFNTLPPGFFPFIPFVNNNPEYILYGRSNSLNIFNPLSASLTDTTLYASYETGDLRKTQFYLVLPFPVQKIYFKGSYTIGIFFGGIATNELYLIKAESLVRLSKLAEGMAVLNALRRSRWDPAHYSDASAAAIPEAVRLIIAEKRKELPFTGQVRWEDLRRLNQDPAYAVTLKRVVNGSILTLPPGDPRYVMPIPHEEIRLTGMEQNER